MDQRLANSPRLHSSSAISSYGSRDVDDRGAEVRRRIAHAAVPMSRIIPAIIPHGVSVGASAAVLVHVPACPARLQRIDGSVQALSQQTLSAQKPVEQAADVVHVPPRGIGGALVGVGMAQ